MYIACSVIYLEQIRGSDVVDDDDDDDDDVFYASATDRCGGGLVFGLSVRECFRASVRPGMRPVSTICQNPLDDFTKL